MDAVKKELLMDAFADDYMTPEAIELVARARALAPKLAERAREAERQGMVPVETVKEMQEAGLFRVLQPKRWGGYELDPRVFYRVQMALAEGCMSTAWIYGVIGVHNWFLISGVLVIAIALLMMSMPAIRSLDDKPAEAMAEVAAEAE